MEEIWKQIDYGNGNYYVSNLGNIKNDVLMLGFEGRRKRFSRLMKPWDNGYGYQVVSLRFGDKKKNFYVHRLVAEYFIGKIPKDYQVHHIDYNKKNNALSNLEICTRQQNVDYSNIHMHNPKNRKTKSGYKFIYFRESGWEVAIQKQGDYGYIGTSKTLKEALNARNKALCESLF